MRVSLHLLCAILAVAPVCFAQHLAAGKKNMPNAAPETIFFNGVIYTGEGLSVDKPRTVQAMAIGGGKVLAIGSNEEIKQLAGPSTRMRDLRGGGQTVFVFPGFNDAHLHLGNAGQTKLNVDLTDAKSLDDMLSRIKDYASNAPAGRWLTGGRWDQTL